MAKSRSVGSLPSNDIVLSYLVEVEEVAEDILTDKRQLIDLDRKRQKTREAVRAVQTVKTDKQWVCLGNMFFKLPTDQTKKLLNKDFDELDKEITEVRQKLKPKVNKLRDIEKKEEIKGFNLNPLSRDELRSIDNLL